MSNLSSIDEKIKIMEDEINKKTEDIMIRVEKVKEQKNEIERIININKNKDIVTFNIGGNVYSTLRENLKGDNLLARLSNVTNDIFIDRSPAYFDFIIYYIRNKKLDYDSMRYGELQNLIEEFEFYNFYDMVDLLNTRIDDVKLINFESSGFHDVENMCANNLEDLYTKDSTTGICTDINGWLIIEFDKEYIFDSFEIANYRNDNYKWCDKNGKDASVSFSKNRLTWKESTRLVNYDSEVKIYKIDTVSAKYIKFQSSYYFSIAYLKIRKIF